MENRERDRVSQRREPTDAGRINRETSENVGREQHGGTAEFGQSIGRSENLSEGGEMRNRKESDVNSGIGSESSRRSGMGNMGSSPGRSGIGSEHSRDESTGRRGSTGSMGNTGTQGGGRSSGDTSEGRH